MKRPALVIGLFAMAGALTALLWPSSDGATSASATAPTAEDYGLPASPSANASRSRSRRHPPVVEIEKGPVSDDPAEPGYDPVKLSHLGMSSTEIYEREPRDPVWAAAMEARVRERLVHDLGIVQPSARPTSVECRTSTCRIVIEASEDLSESAQFTLQVLGNADVHAIVDAQRADDGTVRQTLDALYSAEHRGLDDNAAHYRRVRQSIFRQARELGDEFGMVLPIDDKESARE